MVKTDASDASASRHLQNDTMHELGETAPFLTSLVRLDLKPDALDTHLLVVVSSHPTIVTVAIRPPHNFDIFPALLERGVRFSHLVLEDKRIIDDFSASSLLLHDLKHLDLFFVYGSTNYGSIQNWLLRFAQRHTRLATVKFTYNQGWRHDPDAPFATDFRAAMAAERIWTVTLNSFSIARSAAWTSLQDWRVTQLELGLRDATGILALKAANVLAPHLSSLELVLHGVDYTQPCHIDQFAAPFDSMPFLRTLHLSNGYATFMPPETGLGPSTCVDRASCPAVAGTVKAVCYFRGLSSEDEMRLLLAPFVLAVIFGVRAAPVPVPLDLDARLSPIAPRPKIENLMRREEPSTPHTTATLLAPNSEPVHESDVAVSVSVAASINIDSQHNLKTYIDDPQASEPSTFPASHPTLYL
ncbi:hypothetical protein B0H14DRAFT_3877163 [Mycena olivaceomarginata]|nr:hypothetical protein B0H14DRAFT_3877163 [Mycena olivaceomarginata]